MKAPLNIGLIGCGRAAERLYLPAFSRLKSRARLVAAVDPIYQRRELILSQVPGCKLFASAEALLREADVAALIIASPPETHVPMTEMALRAEIPVLVEKPLALSLVEARNLEELLAYSNGWVMMAFNRRYWVPVCKLRQVISDRKHSDRVSAQLVLKTDAQTWSPISGMSDPLDDLGPHQLDLLRYIFDCEISSISARWINVYAIRMKVRLEDGIVAECLADTRSVSMESITIQCESQNYMARTYLGSKRIQPARGGVRFSLDFCDALGRRLTGRQSSLRRSYELQLMSFFDCVNTGTTPRPDAVDGIAAIRAVEAARKSAADGGKEVLI